MTITLGQAIAFAAEKHKDQRRQNSGDPYITHPLRVMDSKRCDTEVRKIIAILHDVKEDCGVTDDDLRAIGCSEEIISGIDSVTKRPGEEYQDFVKRSAEDPNGLYVKIADVEDNSRDRKSKKYIWALSYLLPLVENNA